MATYVLTTGGHTDYKIIGVFTGPSGVDVKALAKCWARDHPGKAVALDDYRFGPEYFDHDHFRQYVVDQAGLAPVEWEELWLPDYSLDMRSLVQEAGREGPLQ